MGLLMSVGFGVEALLLIPPLFLYVGSLLIAKRRLGRRWGNVHSHSLNPCRVDQSVVFPE